MQGVLRTRRGLAAASAAVIGCILLLLFATAPHWRPLINKEVAEGVPPTSESVATLPASPSPEPTSPASSATAPSAPVNAEAPPPALPTQVPSTSTATAALEPASPAQTAPKPDQRAGPSAIVPSFDIVRIEPTGDSVIAARAAPNSEVTLLDGDLPIAHATADANGEVALLPPPLKPGEHSLKLSVTTPGSGKALLSQAVVASVPQPKTAPTVALIQPNAPATVLSGPEAGAEVAPGSPPAGIGAGEPDNGVAIRSVEVENMGSFLAAGKAAPGSQSRVYLNGSYVATVTADKFGKWELQIKRGMKPGRYAVRVDQVEPKTGKVTARAEVPFDYPRGLSSSLRKRLAGSPQQVSKRVGAQDATVLSEPGRAVTSRMATAAQPGAEAVPPSTGARIASAASPSAVAGSGDVAQTGGAASRAASAHSDNAVASGLATSQPAPGSAVVPDMPKRRDATVAAQSTTPPVTAQSPVAGSAGTAAKTDAPKLGGEPELSASVARGHKTTASQPGNVSPAADAQPEVAKSDRSSAPSLRTSATHVATPATSATAGGSGAAVPLPGSGATGSGEKTRMVASAPSAAASSVLSDPQSQVPGILPGQAPSPDKTGTGGTASQVDAGQGHSTDAGSLGTAPSGMPATAPAPTLSTDEKRVASAGPSDVSQVKAIQGHTDNAGAVGVAASSGLIADGAGQSPGTAGKRTGRMGTEEGTRVDAGQRAAPAKEPGKVASTASTTSVAPDEVQPTVVRELVTATVFRGDSLWRISRKILGYGIRYTQIYAANTKQIRDPNLIYPGQVFVVPQVAPF